MTTLAACRVGSTYALAADRRVMFGSEFVARATPKIAQVAPWLALGVAGPVVAGAWLRTLTTLPQAVETHAELVAQLAHLGESFRAYCVERQITEAAACGITPLGIVRLTPDGSASLFKSLVFADGSGGGYAIGAMHSRIEWGGVGELTARTVAAYGVAVAATYDSGTDHAIDVLTIEAAP